MNIERTAFLGALMMASLSAAAVAQMPATEGQAAWRLDSPLTTAHGLALWLDDGAGSWRVEVGVAGDDPPILDDLLARQGDGWTLACAGGPPVLMLAWGEPWREAGAGLADAVARLLRRWGGSASPPAALASGPWRARQIRPGRHEAIAVGDLPDQWNPAGSGGAGAGALRWDLTQRGRGRGGPGVRLRVRPAPDGGLDLTSARWPGRVHLSPATVQPRPDLPAEAYLPIWSLAEIGLIPLQP